MAQLEVKAFAAGIAGAGKFSAERSGVGEIHASAMREAGGIATGQRLIEIDGNLFDDLTRGGDDDELRGALELRATSDASFGERGHGGQEEEFS